MTIEKLEIGPLTPRFKTLIDKINELVLEHNKLEADHCDLVETVNPKD